MNLDQSSAVHLGVSPYAQGYIQDRAMDLMTSTCRVYTPSTGINTGTYDPVTGKVTATPGTIKYEGPCRLWEVPGGQTIVVGDQELSVTQTYLSMPYWVTPLPERDDVIQILTSDDPDLVGRSVSIVSTIRGGGLRASRRFQVQVADSKKATW